MRLLLEGPHRERMAELVHEDRHEDDRDPRDEQPPFAGLVAEQHGEQPERPVDAHGHAGDVEVRAFVCHACDDDTVPTGMLYRETSARILPKGEEKVRAVRSMFDAIAPRYDLVNRIMTFRMDVGWRRRTVRALGLPPRLAVLDLACGTGDLCRELVRAGLAPIGVDLSFGMLAAARTTAPLVHGDALRLPFADGSIDGATCGFALRNFVALEPFFAALARVVRPGGRIALLEVAEPANAFLRWGHGVYFGKVVPRIGALLSDGAAYRYLPRVGRLPARARRADGHAPRRRVRTTRSATCCRAASRSCSRRTRGMRAVTRRARRATSTSAAPATLQFERGRAGLPGRRGDRCRVAVDRRRRRARSRSRSTTRSGCPGAARSRSARSLRPAAPAS